MAPPPWHWRTMSRLKELNKLGYRTGVINARVLLDKIEDCGDLGGQEFSPESVANLLTRKLDECSLSFIEHIEKHGVSTPICIYDGEGGWCIEDGHHRLAVAVYYDQDVPYVLLSQEDDVVDVTLTLGIDYYASHDTERVIL